MVPEMHFFSHASGKYKIEKSPSMREGAPERAKTALRGRSKFDHADGGQETGS